MSVPKPKRGASKLEVNLAARNACTHVLKITGNEKNFTPDQYDYTRKIRDLALQIDLDCWKANNIRVDDSEEKFNKRMDLEERAAEECTEMLELINIAKPVYHMSTRRYNYLSNQYTDLRTKIYVWNRSDRERLDPHNLQ